MVSVYPYDFVLGPTFHMATPGRHETVSLQQTIYFYYFPVPVSGMFEGLLLGAGVLVHFQSQHDVVGQGGGRFDKSRRNALDPAPGTRQRWCR